MKSELDLLISKLPELYQPIYNAEDVVSKTSRASNDRLVLILDIFKKLKNLLNRQVRVLDLGSAQGYFSFHLANLGANVLGVDFSIENVNLSNLIAKNNPHLDIKFKYDRVENIINNIKDEEYDLVLGLSVFHHVSHEKGHDVVLSLMKTLSEKVKVGIFELAIKEEPLYWASSLPKVARLNLKPFNFVHLLGEFDTHLSQNKRPFFIASNLYTFFGEDFYPFSKFKQLSHDLAKDAHLNSRSYFISDNMIVKQYSYNVRQDIAKLNEEEFNYELQFLKNPPIGFGAPKLFFNGKVAEESWLGREIFEGELLSELIKKNVNFNEREVISQVLNQLICLEKNGLFHNDVRLWNVLILKDGNSKLIDFGSISNNQTDCMWPNNMYISFFFFILEVLSKKIADPSIIRVPDFSVTDKNITYVNAFIEFLNSEDHSFELFKNLIEKNFTTNLPKVAKSYILLQEVLNNAHAEFKTQLSNKISSELFLNSRIDHLEKSLEEAKVRAINAEALSFNLTNSRSWKLTLPLRKGLLILKKISSFKS